MRYFANILELTFFDHELLFESEPPREAGYFFIIFSSASIFIGKNYLNPIAGSFFDIVFAIFILAIETLIFINIFSYVLKSRIQLSSDNAEKIKNFMKLSMGVFIPFAPFCMLADSFQISQFTLFLFLVCGILYIWNISKGISILLQKEKGESLKLILTSLLFLFIFPPILFLYLTGYIAGILF
jgi:hypothetical protein